MEITYVLYAHKNPLTKEVFYIGIGSMKRARALSGRNIFWKRYVAKYGDPEIEILQSGLSLEVVKTLEIEHIAKYGRRGIDANGTLVNVSAGGEGGAGIPVSDYVKKRVSETQKGKTVSAKTREKMSKAGKGRIVRQSTRDLMSSLLKGRSATHNIGRKHTDETKKKLSEKRKGKYVGKNHPRYGVKLTDAEKQNLRSKNLGKKASVDTREKLKISRKRFDPSIKREVINTSTGISYKSIKDALPETGLKYVTFYAMLSGRNNNKTSFKLL